MDQPIQLNLLDKSQPERIKRLQEMVKHRTYLQEMQWKDRILLIKDINLELQNQEVRSFSQYNIKFLIDYINASGGIDSSEIIIDDYLENQKNPYVAAVLLASVGTERAFNKILMNFDLDDLKSSQSKTFHPRFITKDQNQLSQPENNDGIITPKSPVSQSPVFSCLYTLLKLKLTTVSLILSKYLQKRIVATKGYDTLAESILKESHMAYPSYCDLKQFIQAEKNMAYQLVDPKRYEAKLNELQSSVDVANKEFSSMETEVNRIDELIHKDSISDPDYYEIINSIRVFPSAFKVGDTERIIRRFIKEGLWNSHFLLKLIEKVNQSDSLTMPFVDLYDVKYAKEFVISVLIGKITNTTFLETWLTNDFAITYIKMFINHISPTIACMFINMKTEQGQLESLKGIFPDSYIEDLMLKPYQRDILLGIEKNQEGEEQMPHTILSKTNWYNIHKESAQQSKKPWPINTMVAAVALVLFGANKEEIARKYNLSLFELQKAYQNTETREDAEEMTEHYTPEELWYDSNEETVYDKILRQNQEAKSPSNEPSNATSESEKEQNPKVPPAKKKEIKTPKTPLTKTQQTELNILARTLYKEARGESLEGIKAVASVMYNRGGGKSTSIVEKIKKPKQFSCWNGTDWSKYSIVEEKGVNWDICKQIAETIVSGTFKPTTNATHYFNPDKASPNWGKMSDGTWKPNKKIGSHLFMRI